MGRKRKEEEKEGFLASLKKETTEGVMAIIFIIFSIFLILASFSKAGFVGDKVYEFFKLLFGIGYFLLPLILIILGVSFLASLSRNWATLKIIGSSVFLLSGLGLINLLFSKGGIVGNLVSSPLVKLFDFWVTLIFLIGLVVISILVVFDASFKFSIVQKIKEKITGNDEENEFTIETGEEMDEDEPEEEYEEEDEVKVQESPATEKKESTGLVFLSKRSSGREFKAPPLSILERDAGKPGVGDVKANANIIKRTLINFGIQVEMDEVSIGPSVTRYALKPAEGVKLAKIVALQKDLSLALAAHPLRIEAPIPGKSLVGIEIPNTTKTLVGLGSLFRASEFSESNNPLLLCLGKGITGLSHFANLVKMPHVLIAGATGSGKSVTIHTLITSLLYRNDPENLKFIMVDPKRVELTLYNKIPHLLTPVITDAKKTILALKWAAKEMDRRYDILEEKSVRDVESYHSNILKPALDRAKKNPEAEVPENMPYIVIVIDELADIMQAYPRELESAIVRLAQMSRAVGIHIILSTQRPSVNVITGLIKANIPARIALQVSSQIDSRTILDMPGAEKLLGSGDMLFLSGEMSQPRRIQSAFISESEVKKLVKWLIKNYEDDLPDSELDFSGNEESSDSISDSSFDDDEEDELYSEAKAIVIAAGKASTSYLQRKLRVGYARAARLIDMLEDNSVVGPADGSKPREVLTPGDRDSEYSNQEPEEEEEY